MFLELSAKSHAESSWNDPKKLFSNPTHNKVAKCQNSVLTRPPQEDNSLVLCLVFIIFLWTKQLFLCEMNPWSFNRNLSCLKGIRKCLWTTKPETDSLTDLTNMFTVVFFCRLSKWPDKHNNFAVWYGLDTAYKAMWTCSWTQREAADPIGRPHDTCMLYTAPTHSTESK